MRSMAEVMNALDESSKGVQKVSGELSRMMIAFYSASFDETTGEIKEGVGLRFELAQKRELATIYTDALRDQQKVPAADIRDAMAQRALRSTQPTLWAEYHATHARIEALKLWISNQKAAISANQSVLRGERE